MSFLIHPLTIPFILAVFLAVNMGGSGTAPAFSAAYGANVISRRMIPGLFGVMVLLGALLAGQEVSHTLGAGLLEPMLFTPLTTSIILASIALSLFFANLLGVPQSTSQASVLSIAGAAMAMDGLNSRKLLLEIIPTWFILPIIAFFLALFLFKWVFPKFKKGAPHIDYEQLQGHSSLKTLLILSSLYVAFSLGANNVANAVGPIVSLLENHLQFTALKGNIPSYFLSVLVVAPCFALGSSLMGHKATEATGKDIVSVSPFNATIIAVIVASLLLFASVYQGVPTSLVQLNGAAFIALSISKNGNKATWHNKAVRKFFIVWAVAPLFAFLLTYGLVRWLV